jgi:hypothetical protein
MSCVTILLPAFLKAKRLAVLVTILPPMALRKGILDAGMLLSLKRWY